jgi:hypothetical protein
VRVNSTTKVERVTMATSEKFMIRNVRLSFPHLWTPKPFKSADDDENKAPRLRFEAAALIDPTTKEGKANIDLILKHANLVAKEHWPKGPPAGLEIGFGYTNGEDPVEINGKRVRYRECDYDGYEGMFAISTSNTIRPAVVDKDRSRLTEDDGKPYAGCYVNISLSLWTQDNSWGKRINANLRGVQFIADGEAFGAPPIDADEEFDVIEAGDDEFDDDDDPLA